MGKNIRCFAAECRAGGSARQDGGLSCSTLSILECTQPSLLWMFLDCVTILLCLALHERHTVGYTCIILKNTAWLQASLAHRSCHKKLLPTKGFFSLRNPRWLDNLRPLIWLSIHATEPKGQSWTFPGSPGFEARFSYRFVKVFWAVPASYSYSYKLPL